jgi:uncharacterized membrane protein
MSSLAKSSWRVPVALLALGFIPVASGILRLGHLGDLARITPDNARFFAAPWPVVLHIAGAIVYCVLGAFQFSAGLRQRHPHWHRAAGRVLVPAGLAAALAGLLMTQFYPAIAFDGSRALYLVRWMAGSGMAACLCLGLAAIRSRDIPRHRAWMMRAYALGLGAGTQVLTHLPWSLFPAIHGELARTILMAAGWSINLAVAERLIARARAAAPTHPAIPALTV